MDSKEHMSTDPQVMLTEWLRAANKFWAAPEPEKERQPGESDRKKEAPRSVHETAASAMKTLTTLFTAMNDPLLIDATFRGTAILPEIMESFMRSGTKAYLSFQRQLSEKVGKMGSAPPDNLDALQAWTTFYEEEIQRYFHIPQLGLNRFYQERFNKAIDKYNIFVASLTDFLQVLQVPFDRTTQDMQEKIEELKESGKLPDDAREYYQMWVKTLEGHFMTLFKSPEYIEALGNAMGALEDYLGARNSIIQDLLQSFPIPTNKEMNDLYKEVYLLKKKVRELEKAGGKE